MLKEIVIQSKQLLSDAILENTDLGFYRVQKIIKNRSVKINGVRVGVDMNVNAGDVVYAYLPDREKNSIEVVYRDENILVVNKNSGIEVEGPDSLTERINNILTDAVAAPVHRLDRNTMGLVVYALNNFLIHLKFAKLTKPTTALLLELPSNTAQSSKHFCSRMLKRVKSTFLIHKSKVTCQLKHITKC